MLSTPILLITFNRPNHVRQVLSEIRKHLPTVLYISQDGPREGNEEDVEKIKEVRDVIEEIVDWPCEVHTLYQTKNLGCGPGPAAGIDWFFSNVEMGIIMEDDCLPHPDFFGYCEELLCRYKDDSRVMYVSSTLYDDRWRIDSSYGFSHYMITGAWASWARAWNGFDLDLHSLDAKVFRRRCKRLFYSRSEVEWWYYKVLEIQQDKDKKSYWDYQMQIHILNFGGITIHPRVNLISNIGFDSEGTHTLNNASQCGNKRIYPILPLSHPKRLEVEKKRDYLCFAKRHSDGLFRDVVRSIYLSMLFSDRLFPIIKLYKRIKGQDESSIRKHI